MARAAPEFFVKIKSRSPSPGIRSLNAFYLKEIAIFMKIAPLAHFLLIKKINRKTTHSTRNLPSEVRIWPNREILTSLGGGYKNWNPSWDPSWDGSWEFSWKIRLVSARPAGPLSLLLQWPGIFSLCSTPHTYALTQEFDFINPACCLLGKNMYLVYSGCEKSTACWELLES